MKRIYLLGSNVDCLTMEETLLQVEHLIEAGKPTQHVAVNAGKIVLMGKDAELQTIVNKAPLISADGQSIVWAARFLGYTIPERVAGIDLFRQLVAASAEKGWRLFYFGASEEVVQKVISLHQKKYPKLQIVGYHHGYFQEEASGVIAEQIRQSGADIVFVAFSSPKKEKWVHRYLYAMEVPFVMGVGGSFDVEAGITKRAPIWMQKMGLEWFYRFVQEPRRMFMRYFTGNGLFIIKVIKERLTKNAKKN